MTTISKWLSISLLCAICFWVIGCGTTQDHRSRQYSRVFRNFSAQDQVDVLQGRVRLEMAPEAVYVALGAPLSQGRDMSMPTVDSESFERWYYRGQLTEEGSDEVGAWVVFKAQFDSVLSASARGELFVVDFQNRRVSKMWLLDRDYTVLAEWE